MVASVPDRALIQLRGGVPSIRCHLRHPGPEMARADVVWLVHLRELGTNSMIQQSITGVARQVMGGDDLKHEQDR